MQSNPIENIKAIIKELDLKDNIKANLLKEIRSIDKESKYNKFKFGRTLKDKQIITNVLNETIQSLEEKSEALSIQAKELEKQSRFKEQLFASVSHELRTPLHGILGMGHLLEKTPLNNIQNRYIDTIRASADNLLVIINDILNLSAVNAGKTNIKEEPFSLKKLLNELHSLLEVSAQKKGIQLSFSTQANMNEFVSGDRTRVYQILLNLLNNSIKFTKQGSIKISTEKVFSKANQEMIQFEIKDTGIGIKKEKLKSIFESFTRVHNEKGVIYEGAGLGLNIVKNLIHLMNGKIDVESELGKGTSFKVQIPFGIPKPDEVLEFINEQHETTIPAHWSNLKFLMIEDNSANILYSKDIFESWNLHLDIAPNLEDATQKLTTKYDCIFSDVSLPDGNGLEFILKLKNDGTSINKNTPVIILTASANEKEAKIAKEAKIQSYLSKPFPPELLITELHKIFISKQHLKNVNQRSIPITNQKVLASINTHSTGFIDNLSKKFKGKTTLMIEMSKIFLDQAPTMIQYLEEKPEKGEYQDISFEAHKFKSTANIIGLENLRAIANKAEKIYSNGKPNEDTSDLLKDFKKQIKLEVQTVENAIIEMQSASDQ